MTDSPNPNWKPGDPIVTPIGPAGPYVAIDPGQVPSTSMYKLLIGAVVPRPIAFVSTVDSNGVVNLAPFSFFNGVSSNPPAVMIAITRRNDGSKKDTLLNIEANGQFVVNTVSEWMAEPMNHCSGDFPYGVSELEKAGLTAIPSERVRPPRVSQSPIQFECELYGTMEVGDGSMGSSTIVVGRILLAHVHSSVYRDGRIDLDALKPLARLAGAAYGRTSGVFDLPRPKI